VEAAITSRPASYELAYEDEPKGRKGAAMKILDACVLTLGWPGTNEGHGALRTTM